MSYIGGEPNTVDVRNLFVLVTNRCNLVCKHCYVHSSPAGEFGLAAADVVRIAAEFHEMQGRSTLTLSGGEVFARRDVIDAIPMLERLHDVFLLTNATLITPDRAAALRDLRVAIRIGLDGATPGAHDRMRGDGAFDRTMRGIDVLLSSGWSPDRIEFFFTAVDWNVDDIQAILWLADRFGVSKVHVEPVAVHGRAAEHWAKTIPGGEDPFRLRYRRALEEALSAHAGSWRTVERIGDFQSLTIYSDGRAFPYTTIDEIDEATGYLGNVLHEPLAVIFEGSRYWNASMLKLMRHLRGRGQTAAQVRLARIGADPHTTFQ